MAYPVSASEESLLRYNLKVRGFGLFGVIYKKKPIIPTHELLIRMVRDYKEPRATEGLALIIDNDPPDYQALVQNALDNCVQNQIGYVLEGTLQVLKTHKPKGDYSALERATKELFEKRDPEIQALCRIDMPNEEEILMRNRAPEDVRWNIKGGVTFNQFDVQYRVYNGIQYPKRSAGTPQNH